MHYVLNASIDLDMKSTPVQPIQTTRMANTKNARNIRRVTIGSHTVLF